MDRIRDAISERERNMVLNHEHSSEYLFIQRYVLTFFNSFAKNMTFFRHFLCINVTFWTHQCLNLCHLSTKDRDPTLD